MPTNDTSEVARPRGELLAQHANWQAARARLWRSSPVEKPARPAPTPSLSVETVEGWGVPVNLLGAPSALTVIRLVSLKHGIRVSDVKGDSRSRDMVAARDHAIGLVYTHCGPMSTPQLGRLFGGRDHSTIIHSLQKQGIARAPVTSVSFWSENPENDATLATMMAAGHSCAEIAEKLEVTRNTVIGRIRRLRVDGRLPVETPKRFYRDVYGATQ